jgi:uncharacterized membrane protein YtjA (UPF0391 family)
MLRIAMLVLIAAILSGLLGFGGIIQDAAPFRVLFFVCLALFIAALVLKEKPKHQ